MTALPSERGTGVRRAERTPPPAQVGAVRAPAGWQGWRSTLRSSASDSVLEEAGTTVSVRADDDAIDEDLTRFRAFLDEVEPTEFETRRGTDEPPRRRLD